MNQGKNDRETCHRAAGTSVIATPAASAALRQGATVAALAHRLTLRPELWVQQVRAEDVVAERLETVPTPPAEDR